MMKTFSVIINSYGRSYQSLEPALIAATKSGPNELVIIDQNTPNLALPTSEKIKVFVFPETSISKARNKAAAKASGEWLIFVDDDALLSPQAIKELDHYIQAFSHHKIIGGKIMVLESPLESYSKRQDLPAGELKFLNLKSVMGGLFAVEKDTFLKLQGFDENFGIGSLYPSSEDTDFVWKAYFNNTAVGFCPKLMAFHPRSTNISPEKAYSYGIGKGAMVAKWIKREKQWITLLEFFEMIIVSILKGNWMSLKGRLLGWKRYEI